MHTHTHNTLEDIRSSQHLHAYVHIYAHIHHSLKNDRVAKSYTLMSTYTHIHNRLKNIIGDKIALEVLANYCKQTLKCSETRPCLGDPLVMGDVNVFLNPATYNIGCDRE